jgi:demethoxyubiquinone hydroxylase (CLK1/Coq7/Cat5 family)
MNLRLFSTRRFCWKPNLPKHKIVFNTTSYHQAHPVWNLKSAETLEYTHLKPVTFSDKMANLCCTCFRYFYDFISGYKPGKMTENLYIRRFIFLETIAGVPGMVGGMLRHLGSLRNLRNDGGWIHHLIEEAENERMHLLTFLRIRQPGILMRLSIIWTQFIFVVWYSAFYLIFPKTSHRFVGYLEEQAVKTYTQAINDLDKGLLPQWSNMKAPDDAIKYWGLSENGTFREMLVSIRADEANHREYNHHFADIPADRPLEGHMIFVKSTLVGEADKDEEAPPKH